MHRTLFTLLFLLATFPTFAESFKNAPPLTGDMTNLKVLDQPVEIDDVMMSSIDKGLVNLSEYKGKIAVVNLWATWCPPCIKELPSLNALQFSMDKHYLEVLTVSLDKTGLDTVKKYLETNNLSQLPAFVDVNNEWQKLPVLDKIQGIPITLIIDPQTRVLAYFPGDADWNGPAARAVLEYYLKNVSFAPFTTE